MALANSNTIICHILPGPHLCTWVESSNVDKLPCWRTTVHGDGEIRTRDLSDESRVNTPIIPQHPHTITHSCLKQVTYSLNKKEWICSLFKEWILEKSEIRVNLEWTFVLFTHFGVTTGITQGFRVIPEVTPKWVNNTNVNSKFTLISLFSKIHSLKSEHIHSFLFREYSIIGSWWFCGNRQRVLHEQNHRTLKIILSYYIQG